MKLKGGYDVCILGRPDETVEVLPDPDRLLLRLRSRRFLFSEVCVAEGDRVETGHILATDPQNHSVPLLAPRAGVVRLGAVDGHIVLTDVAAAPGDSGAGAPAPDHAPREPAPADASRAKLLALGAWQFFSDAHTGELPDPFGKPAALIVSTLALEPFVARGDVQMYKRLTRFTRGLEHLQGMLEYQPIYLVLPDMRSPFMRMVRLAIRGYAWVKMVAVRPRYPFDSFKLLARYLGLRHDPGAPVWALRTGGVLAVDRALTLSAPCDARIVSLGGPAVRRPRHLKVTPGYPIDDILAGRLGAGPVRVLNGGALTGEVIGPAEPGLDVECDGLTILPEQTRRELFGFAWPGWTKNSFSRWFLSSLRGPFDEAYTTGLRGELRPCLACGLCEEVCPAGIMPHLIHKYLYYDNLEDAEAAGTDLCIGCGLCAYVCPSKIELSRQIIEARELIQAELHGEEAGA